MIKTARSILLWGAIVLLAVAAFAQLALARGESVNAIWLVVAALAVYTIGYRFYARFIASVLPVWLLLAPRDYLSTFLKIGTIVALAVAILVVMPPLKMMAFTQFIDGTGPVFAGALFPFLFITIACGSVSGFHALVSSGTTPKMLERESHVPAIGYGAMLMESFVAIMALIAACVLEPGIYFALNSPAAVIGTTASEAAAVIASWGFTITPDMLTQLAKDVGEPSILSRTGGAPTFAVGMAKILSDLIGGINSLWALFGIANQMLAGMALLLACVILVRMKKILYVWVTAVPAAWILLVTLNAGWQKIFSSDTRIGFLSHAQRFADAIERNEILAPTTSMAQMHQVVMKDYINAGMAGLFVTVVVTMLIYALRAAAQAQRHAQISTSETSIVWRQEELTT